MKERPGGLARYAWILVLAGIVVIAVLISTGPLLRELLSALNNSLVATPTAAAAATSGTVPTLEEQLAQLDKVLGKAVSASIAYNAPDMMDLDKSSTVELLMNPSLTPTALATQITQPGTVVTETIQITPLMKAELIANNPAAFTIQPLQDNAIQVISDSDTTQWSWSVTPQKEGLQELTLVIYRLVKYKGQDYWRNVKSYEATIDVRVPLGKRITNFDWKWIVGIILSLIAIPAFWRWYDHKKRKASGEL